MSAIITAEWKDHQFKEYLENKKAKYILDKERYLKTKGLEQTAVVSQIRKDTIDEIINELFPEQEQDNSNNDE